MGSHNKCYTRCLDVEARLMWIHQLSIWVLPWLLSLKTHGGKNYSVEFITEITDEDKAMWHLVSPSKNIPSQKKDQATVVHGSYGSF